MSIQLAGEEAANIVGPQLGNIDSTFFELLSQQPTYNTNPAAACSSRQSSCIVEMCIVVLKFLGDVARRRLNEPRVRRGMVQFGLVHNGLLKWNHHFSRPQ